MIFDIHNNITTELKDGEILYDRNFLSSVEASRYFKILRNETAWQQDQIKVFGKVYDQPRLTALYANNNFLIVIQISQCIHLLFRQHF